MFYLVMFTLCLVGISLAGLVIADKFPLNGYPVIMMIPLFSIFVVSSLKLHANKIAYNYLEEWMFTFATFICLVSFLSIILGWSYTDIRPKRKESRKTTSLFYYSYNRLFTIGTVCHIISFISELLIASRRGGILALYSRSHSFYLGDDNPLFFYLFFLTFVGMIPYLQCFFCDRNLTTKRRIIIVTIGLLQILRAIVVGQRGWIFNIVFIYITIPFFCLNQKPKLRQVIYFVLPAAFFVIVLPVIRGSIYLGSSDLGRLPELVAQGLSEFSQGSTGSGITDSVDPTRVASEYILGAGTISKAWEQNSYTYGLSFYDCLINPIPRALWPDKPLNISLQSQIDIINNNFPWSFNPGSAPTGLADIFLNFGFFCIPFWFFFGLIHRRIYDSASKPDRFYTQGVYVSLLWGSTYLLNQGVLFWGVNLMNVLFFMTIFYMYARIVKPYKISSLNSDNKRFR